jgi:hypothetical protein
VFFPGTLAGNQGTKRIENGEDEPSRSASPIPPVLQRVERVGQRWAWNWQIIVGVLLLAIMAIIVGVAVLSTW